MKNSDKIGAFLASLVTHFPVRHENEAAEREWLQSISRTLRDYDAATLAKAAAMIVDTRKERRFPLPSEIRDACHKVIDRDRSEKAMRLPFDKALPEWHPDRDRLADDLIMTELGRRAAREQWISALHQFCRKNMRLPEGAEVKGCIDAAKRFDGGYEMALRGQCGAQSHALVALGSSMLAKREELRACVLDGVI